MNIQQEILNLLTQEFDPDSDSIEILDNGHEGHYHCAVKIISEKFAGMSRVQRQQMIYGLLDELLKSNIVHALQLKLQTPEEANQN